MFLKLSKKILNYKKSRPTIREATLKNKFTDYLMAEKIKIRINRKNQNSPPTLQ
jgi:hypothetical protein